MPKANCRIRSVTVEAGSFPHMILREAAERALPLEVGGERRLVEWRDSNRAFPNGPTLVRYRFIHPETYAWSE